MDRRTFLASAAAAAGAAPLAAAEPIAWPQGLPIAVSTYSFWRFQQGLRLPMSECLEQAARMGFDGVELLHVQMEREDNAFLQKLKRQAFHAGLSLCGMSTHQGFVSPDEEVRRKNINHTLHCIELAYKLGIPTIRVNTGRWGTITSFDELMKARGEEPTPEGRTDEEAFRWVIDSLAELLPDAERCGVVLALENHWGLSRTPEAVVRIVEELDSPWLRILLDTGNFLEDPYDKLETIAPFTSFVQAKTYYGGGTWYTLELDYPRIAELLARHQYRGWVSLEFEGKEDYRTAIPASLKVLRGAFGPR